MIIERKEYLNKLITWKDKQLIKIVTGVRRCGKSVLLKMYQDYLKNNGVKESQIVTINFEDLDYEELTNYKKLYNYLDEILYFFEVNNYNIVIFEDLDRFKNPEIFVKLRELNFLINNYEKVDRKVVFIYAIKDDVFLSKERTKFFYFIIPVIPYLNSTNSYEILRKYVLKVSTSIDEDYINDIAPYIDDMRLMNLIFIIKI